MAQANNIARKLIDKNFQVHTYEDLKEEFGSESSDPLDAFELLMETGFVDLPVTEDNSIVVDASNNVYVE